MPTLEAVQEGIAADADWECPICGKNPQFNPETVAAMKEGRAMLEGKIPAVWYHSPEALLAALHKQIQEENA